MEDNVKQSLFYDTSKGKNFEDAVRRWMIRVFEKYGEGELFIKGRKADEGTAVKNAFGDFVVGVWEGAPLLVNHWVVGVETGSLGEIS